MPIVLIGFMGAGKSTVGKLLAQKMKQPQIDLDEQIVKHIDMPISEYFDKYGEEAFREMETTLLKDYLTSPGVLSPGGGVILKEKNQVLLKEHATIVYLQTDLDELLRRIAQDDINYRPLIHNKTLKEVKDIFLPRIPIYEEMADYIVNTTNKTPEEITDVILKKVGD
ncbi:shikimate kinase [Vagococcus sp. JNUCC 83]